MGKTISSAARQAYTTQIANETSEALRMETKARKDMTPEAPVVVKMSSPSMGRRYDVLSLLRQAGGKSITLAKLIPAAAKKGIPFSALVTHLYDTRAPRMSPPLTSQKRIGRGPENEELSLTPHGRKWLERAEKNAK